MLLSSLVVQVAELVHDGGLGDAADFVAGAFAVAVYPRVILPRHGPSSAGGGPVMVGAAVFEGDAVFAAPAPGSHGDIYPGGDDQW
jgi:hypothetical protein